MIMITARVTLEENVMRSRMVARRSHSSVELEEIITNRVQEDIALLEK